MELSNLGDLLLHELADLYDAEQQIVKALPKMAKAADDAKLAAAFTSHLEETRGHVSRLEQAFEALGQRPKREKCEAMKGLLTEGEETMEEDAEPSVLDAALIAAAQKVEHYEIAAYGSLRTWAEILGHTELVALLDETLDEEKAADDKLTAIAVTINVDAADGQERETVEEGEEDTDATGRGSKKSVRPRAASRARRRERAPGR
jgi:ferritin-like metal-binding protein YciE